MTPLTINRQWAQRARTNEWTNERQTWAAHTATAGKSQWNRLIRMLCTVRMRVKTRDTCDSLRARARPRPGLHRCFINETVKLGRGNPARALTERQNKYRYQAFYEEMLWLLKTWFSETERNKKREKDRVKWCEWREEIAHSVAGSSWFLISRVNARRAMCSRKIQ